MINLSYKSFENSKNTGGEGGNNPSGGSGQLTRDQIRQLCVLAKNAGCTHYGLHLPMDTDAQMQTYYALYSANYNLFTLEEYSRVWADEIHNAGMNCLHRGTWSAVKGNNDFPYATYPSGPLFVPLGTVAGASTEGETTYCGKMYRFLDVSLGAAHIADGDIFGPISEFTEYLANSNYLWFDTSAGTQAGAYNFYITLHAVVDAWAAAHNISLDFLTIVNYSEYKTGYLGNELAADTNHLAIDYYGHTGGYSNGQHVSPANYVADWIAVHNQGALGGNYPIYQTEMGGIFSDSWPTLGITGDAYSPKITDYESSAHYQLRFFKAYRDSLVDSGIMNGLNNWGMWSGQNSSIVGFTGGQYFLNYFGQINAAFFKGNGLVRIPVPLEGNFGDDSWGGRSIHF